MIYFTLSGCVSPQYKEYVEQGNTALESKNYQEAVKYFEMALHEKGDEEVKQLLQESKEKVEVQTLVESGIEALDEKQFDDAITIFTKIIEEHTDNPDVKEMVESANASLTKAKAKQEELFMETASKALKDQDYDAAINNFSKVVENNPNHKDAQTLLTYSESMNNGMIALNNEKFDEAIAIFTNVIEKNESKSSFGEFVDIAKASLEKANENKRRSLLDLAHTAIDQKEYENARKLLSSLLDLTPENEEVKNLHRYSENMEKGLKAMDNGQFAEANIFFTVALLAKPNDEEALILESESYRRHWDNMEAVEVANKNTYTEVIDGATNEFIQSMRYLMDYYNKNVLNQFEGLNNGMTSHSYLMSTVGSIYRETLNINVPYPDYQSIVDNWIKCLEATNKQLEMLEEVSGGNTDAFVVNEYIHEIFDYYQLAEDGLNSIE